MQPTIHNAVLDSYSNAVTVWGEDVNSLIVHDANGNPITINTSTVTTKLSTLQSEYETQQQAKTQQKQNAIAKLTALGLTQEEISSLGV
jgi:DNA-binding NarL/FixJ family response regulator